MPVCLLAVRDAVEQIGVTGRVQPNHAVLLQNPELGANCRWQVRVVALGDLIRAALNRDRRRGVEMLGGFDQHLDTKVVFLSLQNRLQKLQRPHLLLGKGAVPLATLQPAQPRSTKAPLYPRLGRLSRRVQLSLNISLFMPYPVALAAFSRLTDVLCGPNLPGTNLGE